MKCKLCGRETTWDESYGPEEMIVCPVCFDTLVNFYMYEGKITKEEAISKVMSKLLK